MNFFVVFVRENGERLVAVNNRRCLTSFVPEYVPHERPDNFFHLRLDRAAALHLMTAAREARIVPAEGKFRLVPLAE